MRTLTIYQGILAPLVTLAALASTGCSGTTANLGVQVQDITGAPIRSARILINGQLRCDAGPRCEHEVPAGATSIQVFMPGDSVPIVLHRALVAGKEERVVVLVAGAENRKPTPNGGVMVVSLETPDAHVRLLRIKPSFAEKDISEDLAAAGREGVRIKVPRGEQWALLATKVGMPPAYRLLSFAREGDEGRLEVKLSADSASAGAQSTPLSAGASLPAEMTPPEPIGGSPLEYPPEAREQRLEGKVRVRCVITIEGALIECKVVQSAGRILDDAALAWAQKQRMTPVLYRGVPQSIFYTLTLNFKLP